jgi:hypothetical protein
MLLAALLLLLPSKPLHWKELEAMLLLLPQPAGGGGGGGGGGEAAVVAAADTISALGWPIKPSLSSSSAMRSCTPACMHMVIIALVANHW